MADNRKTFVLRDEELGTVRIAEELVTTIAALAATEVDGVSSLSGNITHDQIRRASMRALSQGVKCAVGEGTVRFSLAVNVDYDRNIMDVSREVQERVRTAVETMTGLSVQEVKIKVADVSMAPKQ